MGRYLQERPRDAISRAQHTTRSENFLLSLGTWVMCLLRGKVTRGVVMAPSKSGLWLGPARLIMTESVSTKEWICVFDGQIGVVWTSHGNALIRVTLQLRRCSE